MKQVDSVLLYVLQHRVGIVTMAKGGFRISQ